MWNRHIRRSIGKTDIDDFTKTKIIRCVHAKDDGVDGKKRNANMLFGLVRQILNYALSLDYITVNPMTGLKVPYKNNVRDRYLSDEEIAIFWNGIDEVSNLSPPVKIALKLALVTGQRRIEIAYMSKAELNLTEKVWSLPKERTKNKQVHDVPLSDLAISLIEEVLPHSGYSDYIFPSPRFKGQPVDKKVLTRAWARARVQLGMEDASCMISAEPAPQACKSLALGLKSQKQFWHCRNLSTS